MRKAEIDSLTQEIIGAAIEVHWTLGPGLLESAYVYKGMQLDCGYQLDILVANTVVLELKAVEMLAPIHEAQMLSYLRLGGWKIGLLMNFHVPVLKRGIKRIVYKLED